MTFLLIGLGVFVVIGIVRGVQRSTQISAGKNRCAYCRTHLRKMPDKVHYATTCRKCGRTQPWAKV